MALAGSFNTHQHGYINTAAVVLYAFTSGLCNCVTPLPACPRTYLSPLSRQSLSAASHLVLPLRMLLLALAWVRLLTRLLLGCRAPIWWLLASLAMSNEHLHAFVFAASAGDVCPDRIGKVGSLSLPLSCALHLIRHCRLCLRTHVPYAGRRALGPQHPHHHNALRRYAHSFAPVSSHLLASSPGYSTLAPCPFISLLFPPDISCSLPFLSSSLFPFIPLPFSLGMFRARSASFCAHLAISPMSDACPQPVNIE